MKMFTFSSNRVPKKPKNKQTKQRPKSQFVNVVSGFGLIQI